MTDAFGSTRQADVAGALPLSIFPDLRHEDRQSRPRSRRSSCGRGATRRRADRSRRVWQRLGPICSNFGSKDRVGTLDVGDTRSFTPVLGSDIYDEARGYGFFPRPGRRRTTVAGWINDPIERGSTRMNPDHAFRFRAGRPVVTGSGSASTHRGRGSSHSRGRLGGDKDLPNHARRPGRVHGNRSRSRPAHSFQHGLRRPPLADIDRGAETRPRIEANQRNRSGLTGGRAVSDLTLVGSAPCSKSCFLAWKRTFPELTPRMGDVCTRQNSSLQTIVCA